MIDNIEPEYQDEVKHINYHFTGIVIAKYKMMDGETYLDVRGVNAEDGSERIYYRSNINNWRFLRKEEDII